MAKCGALAAAIFASSAFFDRGPILASATTGGDSGGALDGGDGGGDGGSPSPPPQTNEAISLSGGDGGSKVPSPTGKDPRSIATQSQASVSTSASTQGATNTENPGSRKNDPIAVQIVRLDDSGTNQFNNGVEKIALGITQLSQAETDRQESGETAAVKADRNQAIEKLADGEHDVASGRKVVDHANAIKAAENRLVNVGAASAFIPHQLEFSKEKAPESAQQALELMEKNSPVKAQALIEAVNRGSPEAVLDLAAAATGHQMSSAEIAALMPSYATSEAAVGSNFPSLPATSEASFSNTKAADASKAPEKSTANFSDRRTPASQDRPHRAATVQEESLQPLTSEQFLGGTEPVGSLGAGSEFGDPSETLFHRVRAQYSKHRPDLIPHGGASAR